MESETELIIRAQDGDAVAFESLVRTHIDGVYSFVLRYLGNSEEADDATQETFLKAWRSLGRFDARKPLRPWLFAIAKNAATDITRKRRGIAFSKLDNEDDSRTFAESVPDTEPLPDELFESKESRERVSRGVAELPPRERAIISLRYEQGFSFDEIGKVLKMLPTTVRSVHHRALAKLRTLLTRESMQQKHPHGRI